MEQLLAQWQQGLWYWHDDDTALMYRDLPKCRGQANRACPSRRQNNDLRTYLTTITFG